MWTCLPTTCLAARFVRIRHCAAAFFLQVPNSRTDLDLTLLYISILRRYGKLVRKNKMLTLGVCLLQPCPSAGRRFAAFEQNRWAWTTQKRNQAWVRNVSTHFFDLLHPVARSERQRNANWKPKWWGDFSELQFKSNQNLDLHLYRKIQWNSNSIKLSNRICTARHQGIWVSRFWLID